MKTKTVKLSDSQIKQHGPTQIKQLIDERTGLRFRYFTNRAQGAFHLRHYTQGKEVWRKVANWPDTPAHTVIERLNDVRIRLCADIRAARLQVQGWQQVSELLTWYMARVQRARNLSDQRKASVKSAIYAQLLPRIGQLPVTALTKAQLDDHLVWPLQEEYCLAYVQSIYKVLKAAYKQAYKLERIEQNPLAHWVFSDFIAAQVKPKPGALQQKHTPALMAQLSGELTAPRMLCVWMALHATRIAETRAMRWQWIDWDNRRFTIPGQYTKNKLPHTLPLTPVAELVLRVYKVSQQAMNKSQVFLFPGNNRKAISHSKANEWVQSISNNDWTAHDLRKLARSIWTNQGTEHWLGERLINHAQKGLDAVYNQAQIQARMENTLITYHGLFCAQDFYVSAPGQCRDQIKTTLSAKPRQIRPTA